MNFVFRVHEWLADHISWVQYPRPRMRTVSGHPHGLRARWAMRKPMNRGLAICLPTFLLFVPWVGVYLSVASVLFLFAYFSRRW